MAQKSRAQFKALDKADMSVSQTSAATDIGHLDNVSYNVFWSGTSPTGQIFVETTNQDPKDLVNTPFWSVLDFGALIPVAGNSGDHVLNIQQAPFAFIRIRYVPSGGTGTISAILHTKQLGG
jgi:hypothetical protein